MKFTLTINSDNDACQDAQDLIHILEGEVQRLRRLAQDGWLAKENAGHILDINGNVVGEWSWGEEGWDNARTPARE